MYIVLKRFLSHLTETLISGTKLPLKWCQIWGIQFIPTVRETALEILSSSVENDGTVTLKVFNSSLDMLLVHKGCRLAHARPLTECDSLFCVDTSELQMAQPSDNEITTLLKRLNLNSEKQRNWTCAS